MKVYNRSDARMHHVFGNMIEILSLASRSHVTRGQVGNDRLLDVAVKRGYLQKDFVWGIGLVFLITSLGQQVLDCEGKE